jgi:hypothetical protein
MLAKQALSAYLPLYFAIVDGLLQHLVALEKAAM